MTDSTMSTLYLPGVESNLKPGLYKDLIDSARGRQAEYSKIWTRSRSSVSLRQYRRYSRQIRRHRDIDSYPAPAIHKSRVEIVR